MLTTIVLLVAQVALFAALWRLIYLQDQLWSARVSRRWHKRNHMDCAERCRRQSRRIVKLESQLTAVHRAIDSAPGCPAGKSADQPA